MVDQDVGGDPGEACRRASRSTAWTVPALQQAQHHLLRPGPRPPARSARWLLVDDRGAQGPDLPPQRIPGGPRGCAAPACARSGLHPEAPGSSPAAPPSWAGRGTVADPGAPASCRRRAPGHRGPSPLLSGALTSVSITGSSFAIGHHAYRWGPNAWAAGAGAGRPSAGPDPRTREPVRKRAGERDNGMPQRAPAFGPGARDRRNVCARTGRFHHVSPFARGQERPEGGVPGRVFLQEMRRARRRRGLVRAPTGRALFSAPLHLHIRPGAEILDPLAFAEAVGDLMPGIRLAQMPPPLLLTVGVVAVPVHVQVGQGSGG